MKKVGREVLFLDTKENNPRNGEGGFIRLKNGAIMLGYTEYFGDSWADHASARLVCMTSYDEGETWTDKKVLVEKPEESKNVMSLSFLRMNNGDIGAFYIHKNLDGTDKILFIRSGDEGETWSEPISCMDCLEEQDYYVLNNDRVLKLQNGRIIFAASRHSIFDDRFDFAPGEVFFFVSDDDGYTWKRTSARLCCPFEDEPNGYQEPGLYQFEDGKLWCYIRSALGCQMRSYSEDNGETWTQPSLHKFFTSPLSPMLVKDVGDYTVAIFNPSPHYILKSETEPWGRTPYVCAVSTDKGQTFTKEKLFYIEDDLTNGYCYPAIIEGDDYFLVAYYHSNNTGVCLNSLKVVKIMYSEIED